MKTKKNSKNKRELAKQKNKTKERTASRIPSRSLLNGHHLEELFPSTVRDICDVQDSDTRYLNPQITPSKDIDTPIPWDDSKMPIGEELYTTVTPEKESPLITLMEPSDRSPLTVDAQPTSSVQTSRQPSSLLVVNKTSQIQVVNKSMNSTVTEAVTTPVVLAVLSTSVISPPKATSQSQSAVSTAHISPSENLPKTTFAATRQMLKGQSVGTAKMKATELEAKVRVERVRQLMKLDREYHETRLKVLFEQHQQTLQNLKNQDAREAETHQKEISKK